MFLGPVINVAIGLIAIFALMALVVSGTTSAITAFFNTAGKSLSDAVRNLLNDPAGKGLAGLVMNHPQITPLVLPVEPGAAIGSSKLPATIEPRKFALALIQSAQLKQGLTPLELDKTIATVTDPQIKELLTSLYAQANGDLVKLETELSGWFENAMTHLSEAYGRRIRLISLGIAALLAALLNVDALHVARGIWASPDLVGQLAGVQGVDADAFKAMKQLAAGGFPVGWTPERIAAVRADGGGLLLLTMVPGWLCTAAASMLGAPFWFDLLKKLRSATASVAAAAPPAPAVTTATATATSIPAKT
ncbi:hypothetical protein [Paramagnetospirillum magneticum]|uniref:Uncharacterized protein n=1 Tax=Paramagnetospirillum magneticum (strain ATCC 700264 / AMB-1) TaxID=342108 RepID=Q2W074_PARM1|nr:hypothetical protein [Paramagnetospirillum magneticum]BAE52751.1 hypothetical protein amb3947 [Paramagnetospirillum magneticum AMB-1]